MKIYNKFIFFLLSLKDKEIKDSVNIKNDCYSIRDILSLGQNKQV